MIQWDIEHITAKNNLHVFFETGNLYDHDHENAHVLLLFVSTNASYMNIHLL